MTSSFQLRLPGAISFGVGRVAELPDIVSGMGSRVLLVTGSDPQRHREISAAIQARVADVRVVPVGGEPTVADARSAAAAGRSGDADVVVAIGGGSVIDLAKSAAVLLANGGDPMDYIEVVGRGLPIRQRPLPLVAVPTTAGTGAEVTANAVLSVPEHGLKASLRNPMMIPAHAIVDPALSVGCSPEVTAAAGMDALTQCLEPYVSIMANPVTDAWARTGLIHAGRGLIRAHSHGTDLAARTDMALCSLLGGLALANAKLGVVHGFAGVLGGMTPASHGAICAALLAPTCQMNLRRGGAQLRDRYTDVARWLTGDPSATAEDGISWMSATTQALGIRRLSEYGMSEADADLIVAKVSRASSTKGNPVVLAEADLTEILRSAL